MHASAASPGIPGEPTRLLGGLQQKFTPETGAFECFRLFGKTPRGSTHGICYSILLSRGPAVIIPWRGKKTPGISTKRGEQMERKNIPFVCYNCST